MRHKFNVGDYVKAIVDGSGISYDELGTVVKIVERGFYADGLGYRVDPRIGNSKTGEYNRMIGEESFERHICERSFEF